MDEFHGAREIRVVLLLVLSLLFVFTLMMFFYNHCARENNPRPSSLEAGLNERAAEGELNT